VYGAFGPADYPNGKGVLHDMTQPHFDDDGDRVRVSWRVDFGSAPDAALDALTRAIEGWCQAAELEGGTLTLGPLA
jgi:hypothetical protein